MDSAPLLRETGTQSSSTGRGSCRTDPSTVLTERGRVGREELALHQGILLGLSVTEDAAIEYLVEVSLVSSLKKCILGWTGNKAV